MKKFILPILATLMLACGAGALTVNNYDDEMLGGSGFELMKTSMDAAPVTTGGDTSTMTFDVGSASRIDLYIGFTASSAPSELNWTYYFTDARPEDTATWYAEDGKTVSTDVLTTHGATGMVHSWTPATTTAQYKNITVDPMAAQQMRIVFSGVTANGMVSAVVLRKVERP